jgi:hypothetical protein
MTRAFLRMLAVAGMLARPAQGQSHILPPAVDSAAVPLTIGLELSQPMGIALTSGGFFLADMHNPSVSKHAADGRLLWQLKAKGRGPGDILQPYRIAATSDGGVLVFDQMVRDFSKFSSSGAFVKRFRMNITLQTVDNMAVLPNGQIAIAGYTRDPRAAAGAVHVFSEAGEWERSLGPLPETKDVSKLQYLGAGLLDMRPDGRLLFTRKGPYEILEFDLRGGVRRLQVPRVIGPIADSVVDITTDSKGTERISSRAALMTVPFRTIAVGNSGYLSMYSQRGQKMIAMHSATGAMRGPVMPADVGLTAFDTVRCRFLGFQTRDDEPTLVEVALVPRVDRPAKPRANDRVVPCQP